MALSPLYVHVLLRQGTSIAGKPTSQAAPHYLRGGIKGAAIRSWLPTGELSVIHRLCFLVEPEVSFVI